MRELVWSLFGRRVATERDALSHTALLAYAYPCIHLARGSFKKIMTLVSPSVQSVQAFVFGLDNDSKSHERPIPPDLVDEDVYLEGDEKLQSMYVELLDGT